MLAAQDHRQKTTKHNIKDTKLTISAKFRITHDLNCPKILGNDPNGKKYLKSTISIKSEHSSLPTQNK